MPEDSISDSSKEGLYETEGIDKGKVKDPEKAWDIAYGQKKERDDAVNRDAELRRQAEVGLTPIEERNLAVMDGVKEKYPLAGREVIDSKGRKILNVRYPLEVGGAVDYYFTQYGVFQNPSPELTAEDFNLTVLLDTASNLGENFGSNNFGSERFDRQLLIKTESQDKWPKAYPAIGIRRYDIESTSVRDTLRTVLTTAQEQSEKYKREQESIEKNSTAEAILADL